MTIENWRKLLCAINEGPVNYYNVGPIVRLRGYRALNYLEEIVWRDYYSDSSYAPAVLETIRCRSRGEYRTTPEEAAEYTRILEELDAGVLDPKWVRDTAEIHHGIKLEIAKLTSPGWIFGKSFFAGGATTVATWVYALRAHARGKLHFPHNVPDLESQAGLLSRALQQCPIIFKGIELPQVRK